MNATASLSPTLHLRRRSHGLGQSAIAVVAIVAVATTLVVRANISARAQRR